MLPKDWKKVTVGDVCQFTNGTGFSEKSWSKTGLPIIRIQNLNGSRVFNYFAGDPDPKWIVESGDLLFAWAGVPGVSFGPTLWTGPRGVLNQHIYRVTPLSQTDKAWLHAALQVVTSSIEKNAHGFKSSLLHVHKSDITEHAIGRPPLAEQRAIAAVLSAWDRAIGQATALIAAKARLKQGLMQQLFGEAAYSQRQLESKLCHLGDVASETTRRNGGGLGTDAVYSVTKANGMIPMPADTIGSDIARYKLVRPKAFAYNPMRINIGSIARWEGDGEVLVSPDYVVFECGPELDPDYLDHFRRGHVWDSYVKRSGDGSVRVRIYFDHLSRMRIRLPGIQEQRRIAKVLDAATAELRLLERKLNALKQQKRGLMQQLLTGTRRIPPAILRRFSHD